MTQKSKCCIKHLKEHKLKHREIAEICNCSIGTVQKTGRENDLGYGQGVTHYWEFTGPSSELSYVVGAYLSDGSVNSKYNQFVFTNTNERFANLVHECLIKIGAPSARTFYTKEHLNRTSKITATKGKYTVASYCHHLCQFLERQTSRKQSIPQFIMNGNLSCKLAMIAAIIDSDGRIKKDGSIEVRGVSGFLFDLNDMSRELGVRTNNLRIESVLESGKEYRSLSIRRSDFVSIGGYCIIAEKMERILYAKDTRVRVKKPPKTYSCPECGQKTRSQNAKTCRACYKTSSALIERLRAQASKAGIAGNKVRWGT